MAELVRTGEGEAFGEGVEELAELHAAQQAPEFGADRGRWRHRWVPSVPVDRCGANSSGSRANRGVMTSPVGAGAAAAVEAPFSVPRSSIRPTIPTLTASASSTLAQAASTRSGPHFFTRPSRASAWRIFVQGNGWSRIPSAIAPIEGPCPAAMRRRASRSPKRVGGPLGGQVLGVGAAPAGGLAGVDLYELPAGGHPDQLAVGAHLDGRADQVPGDRVEGLGDLDVMVPVGLRGRVVRHVIGRRWRGQQARGLLQREGPGGLGLDRAVDPHPGPLAAPHLGPALGVGEIDERLAGDERLADERHGPLDPRLVLR